MMADVGFNIIDGKLVAHGDKDPNIAAYIMGAIAACIAVVLILCGVAWS
jgi:hypothetical protein